LLSTVNNITAESEFKGANLVRIAAKHTELFSYSVSHIILSSYHKMLRHLHALYGRL
jgi:hypothetical protein